MNTYLLLFAIAACSSLILTPLVRRLCERFGWLDRWRDSGRGHHPKPVPRLGGVAIFVSVLLALSILPFIQNLLTASLSANKSQLFAVLVPASLILLVGVYDDFRGTDARFKFIAQAVAGVIFYAMGGRIETLSIPLVGTVVLPQVVGCLLTVLWTVAITNAFNLIDGIDGLAAGAALFASLVVLLVSLMLGHPHVTVVALVLSGALIGFLRYNFNPASIFLGDSGSLFIGFTLSAISLQGAQKASTAVAIAIPLMAFGLPVIDTGFTMARRFLSRKPIFQGDEEHIHHMLLARGWSQRRAVFVLYGVCSTLGLASLLFINESGRVTGLILLVVGSAVVLLAGRLRYHEVDEVKASMKRNLGERRVRAANHLRIRRACLAISKAESLAKLLSDVGEMLDLGEFVHASARLGRRGDSDGNQRALDRENGPLTSMGVEFREGMIHWSWNRGDIDAADIIGSNRFWTLRLPLTTGEAEWGYINLYRGFDSDALLLDINYLCHLFQREMSCATERVMSSREASAVDEVPMTLSASTGD